MVPQTEAETETEAHPAPGRLLAGEPASEQALRVVDATLRCVARWGLAKTTLDDVAREAGYSRATVYRMFPGGKDGLVQAVAAVELRRFFAGLARRMEGAETLEDLLVAGMTEAAGRLAGHQALQFLLAHELEAVLPHLAFRRKAALLDAAAAFAGGYLERWLAPDDAARAAEWVTRVLLSYVACPAPAADVTDEDSVRRLVRTFVLPGLRPLAAASGPAGAGVDSPL
jgi:AcrR family transcriptional regulator